MVKITEDFVPISSNHRPGIKRTGFRGVTIHETGNFSPGSNAKNHNAFYHNLAAENKPPQIGYHYFVDDREAFLEHPLDEIAWTCGDRNGDGNMKTVSIEICVNPEGDFKKARDNAAYIAAEILYKNGAKAVIDGLKDKTNGNLWQHWSWSGKNCPETIRKLEYWEEFVKAAKIHLAGLWAADKKKLYRVQVGAFSQKENAERFANELKALGYRVIIKEDLQ